MIIKPTRIYFLNDLSIYNDRYRSKLMNHFKDSGVAVESVGFKDNILRFLFICFKPMLKESRVSSNLKSNIIFLFFFLTRGYVIINGLGRLRKRWLFRITLLFLIKINTRKYFLIQNYADFRYFRYLKVKNCTWVPGSGGTKRIKGKNSEIVVITRAEKLNNIYESLKNFIINTDYKVHIVGCTKDDANKIDLDLVNIEYHGYVNQKKLFKSGTIFFQPNGYGEGIPHSLVDAICSEMDIIISKKQFISFGMYKMNFHYEYYDNNYLYIESNASNISKVSYTYLNKIYENIIFRN